MATVEAPARPAEALRLRVRARVADQAVFGPRDRAAIADAARGLNVNAAVACAWLARLTGRRES